MQRGKQDRQSITLSTDDNTLSNHFPNFLVSRSNAGTDYFVAFLIPHWHRRKCGNCGFGDVTLFENSRVHVRSIPKSIRSRVR
jgi:hypothetical protein